MIYLHIYIYSIGESHCSCDINRIKMIHSCMWIYTKVIDYSLQVARAKDISPLCTGVSHELIYGIACWMYYIYTYIYKVRAFIGTRGKRTVCSNSFRSLPPHITHSPIGRTHQSSLGSFIPEAHRIIPGDPWSRTFNYLYISIRRCKNFFSFFPFFEVVCGFKRTKENN